MFDAGVVNWGYPIGIATKVLFVQGFQKAGHFEPWYREWR
jgi:hypothetical protein